MSPTSTRYALLGLLTLAPQSGASGYDLRRWAESSIGHFWRESYGQIYPVLKQLLRDGLVTASEGAGSGKRETIAGVADEPGPHPAAAARRVVETVLRPGGAGRRQCRPRPRPAAVSPR